MALARVFLLGGGFTAAAVPMVNGPFVAAAGGRSARIACVLLDGEDREEHFAGATGALSSVGAGATFPVFVSPNRSLKADDLAEATGVLVGGGSTPGYHDALVGNAAEWLAPVLARGLPYAGYSAGAMIAPSRAIVGGWRLPADEPDAPGTVICPQEVNEDEEFLDVRPGLGLVPFAVDAHASHYGTLTRLLHAV
ncbi:MAG: Type 1 glutamine amidotransferase-like domain-containing protein [Chloroflexota bacterium]|nr:Type 1 glutamine amidotransferase-like domain-containing protein [Chloroflexota bacterium]